MTDKITLQNVTSIDNTLLTAINNNNAAITAAINNTLSRDGTAPNQMTAGLDMNSQPIVNVPFAAQNTEPVIMGQLANVGSVPVGFPTLTGDITGIVNTSTGQVPTTLATVNSNVGTFGDATDIPVVTVNAKGLVTAASQVTPQFTQAGTGAVTRNISSKLQEIASVQDFGAVGDGTTDNSTAFNNAMAAFNTLTIPQASGTYNTNSIAATAYTGRWHGDGVVVDSSGNQRGRYYSTISAPPSTVSNPNGGQETAFNGPMNAVQFPVEHYITGSTTLGTPTTGYMYTPNAYPVYMSMFNSSGWNQSTSSNDGRTAAVLQYLFVNHAGQGDGMVQSLTCSMGSQVNAGATSWLSNPCAVLIGGGVFPGANGQGLTPVQYNLNDNGHDVAGVGIVLSMTRTINTGALGAFWGSFQSQSNGSKPIDYALGIVGAHNFGIDFTTANLGINNCAVGLLADQKIYGNASNGGGLFGNNPGTSYFTYASSISGWNFVVSNSSIFQINASQVTATQPFVDTNSIKALSTGTATSGGVSTVAYSIGTTNFGIYWGSGAPTITAPHGSLYLRTDGSSTTSRAYINTTGSTTWTAITTSA